MATVTNKTRTRTRTLHGRAIPAAAPATLRPLGWRERLGESEIRRRFWHMSPGFLPLILWVIPHSDPISALGKGIFLGTIGILATLIFVYFRKIERVGEKTDRAGAVLGYACSILATLFLFPAQMELGLVVLMVLAFGDGSATLFGKLIGGAKLPWNKQKSWSGFAAFICMGGTAASIIYWGETYFNPRSLDPNPGFAVAMVCGGTAAILAALAESIPSRINDNIRVGVTAAIGVVIAHALTVGF
jgi:dolichol kinase